MKATNQPAKALPEDASQGHGDFSPYFSGAVGIILTQFPCCRGEKPKVQKGRVSCPVVQLLCGGMQVRGPGWPSVSHSVWFHFLTPLPPAPQCLFRGLGRVYVGTRAPGPQEYTAVFWPFPRRVQGEKQSELGGSGTTLSLLFSVFLFPGQRPRSSDELIDSPGQVSAEPGQGFSGSESCLEEMISLRSPARERRASEGPLFPTARSAFALPPACPEAPAQCGYRAVMSTVSLEPTDP